jgi:hypothetical protein
MIAFSLAILCSGCKESRCEKYANLEWKCGNHLESEKKITLELSEGLCELANLGEVEEAKTSRMMIGDGLACFETAKDCASYEACKDKHER